MNSIFSPHTYQFKALHKTAILRGIFVFLALIFGLGLVIEIAARLFIIPGPFPSLGSDNFYFDYKIYTLESQVRHEGPLDCIVVGSSVAHFNLDPAMLETAYNKKTGQKIRCFNIGIPALTVETAAPVTEAILKRYQPKIVIFIIMPRDLMAHEFSVRQLANNPWVAYQRGNTSPENWLRVNSYALRYFTTWQYWRTPSNRKKMSDETDLINPAIRGFSGRKGFNELSPPNWLVENDENLQSIWQTEQTPQALERLTNLEKFNTKIIFIEAPAYSIVNLERQDPAIQYYEQDYTAKLQAYLEEKNIPFWRTLEIGRQIPDSGWYDWLHLNSEGAQTFSQWVGEKLAETPELFK